MRVMVVLLIAGCAGAPSDESSVALDLKNKCKPGKVKKKCTATSAVIDVEGGTIETEDGVTLDVPFGALAEPTTLTVTTSTFEVAGALSPVYVFEPAGTVFARPLEVTLPLPAGLTDASVYWSRLGEPGFDAIGGTIDAVAGTITATTGHFSEAYVGAASSTRTVTGVYVRTWISASTRVNEPLDFSVHTVEALVDNGTSYTTLPGQAGAPGTFEIDNVPDGEYVLHAVTDGAIPNVYLVTSTNTPDLGISFGGRPLAQRTPLTQSTALNLDVSNMVPWSANDWLELYSTEADNWSFNLQDYSPTLDVGHTSTSINFDMLDTAFGLPFGASTINGAAGDRVIVAQLAERTSANGVPYLSLTRMKQLDPFDLPDGGSHSATIALDDVSLGNTIALDYRGTQFAAELAIDDNPAGHNTCLICGGLVGVLGQAGFASDGFYTANADLLLLEDKAPAGTDALTGAMSYGSPGALPGQWGEIFLARYTRRLRLRLPDTSAPVLVFTGYDWVTTVASGASTTLAPQLTQPRSITVDGVDAFVGSTTLSATPTVSWQPPRIGVPDLYTIDVMELFVDSNNNTARQHRAHIVTPHTSFRFPPGIIDPAKSYAFRVWATKGTTPESTAALLAAPMRARLDAIDVSVVSAPFGPVRGNPPRESFVQENLVSPAGIATDGTSIYWADYGTGEIWTAATDGSNPHVLVNNQAGPQKLATDGTMLYWTNFDDGSVRSLDLVTLVETTLVSGRAWLGDIVTHAGDVYWFGDGLEVMRAGQTIPETLAWVGGVNLDTDGANLYWTDYGNGPPDATGNVWSMPTAGGTPVALVQNQPQTWDVHGDGTNVYWSNQAWQQPYPASINSVPAGGGAPITLATGDQIMKVFGIANGNAYWVDDWRLFSVPLTGGTPTQIGPPLNNGGCPEWDLVIGGGAAFWTDNCTFGVVRVEL